MSTLPTQIIFRKGMSSAWATSNPILALGEPGFALDTQMLKIGDGVTRWNDLPGWERVGPVGETGPTGPTGGYVYQ